MTSDVRIGDRVVGPGHPCLVVAEAGVNHNGDPRLAHELVDVARKAGADAVKFQTFDPDQLVTSQAAAAPYQRRATEAKTQHEMLTELVLPTAVLGELAGHAADCGLIFLSTPFDRTSADVLATLAMPAFKVPSGELNNLDFIADLARRDRPLILSTGMATMEEVATAVNTAAAAPGICLLHCVTAYPASPSSANIRAIATMMSAFDVPVGWSDHTLGAVTAVAAVTLGATLLEKHITTDRGLPGPDHAASADPDTFAAYVDAVRECEAALGDGRKRPVPEEELNRVHARRSLHAARDLRAGLTLEAADVVALRPATGLPPDTPIQGRRLKRPVSAHHPITGEDVD